MDVALQDVITSECSTFAGVVKVLDLGGCGSFLGQTSIGAQRVHVFLEPTTALQDIEKVTLLNCPILLSDCGTPKLVQGSDTVVFLHESFNPTRFNRVRETCVGIGALGVGLRHLGLQVCAQNDLQPITCKEAARISNLPVIEGDICNDSTVAALWNQSPGDAILAAGVSCQPYSRLGDQRGEADSRSSSLIGSLRAAHLLQSSAILLECVEPASSHPFVQASLRQFCDVTGFHCTQVVLPLHLVWAAKRTRWWALLTSPSIGQVQVQPWKAHGPWHSVEDVIECFNVTPAEAEQLVLTEAEVSAFQALKPLSDYLLRRNQPLPTALHSWGSPLSPCPCGCRTRPFTLNRLEKGGICSVVVPLGDYGTQKLRHLSPAEVSLLNGLSPSTPFGPNCKLSLALVGQLASPLQAAWVAVPLLNQLRRLGADFCPPLDALRVLQGQRRLLLCEAEASGFRPCTLPKGAPGETPPFVGPAQADAVCAATDLLPPLKKRRVPAGEAEPRAPTVRADRVAMPSAPIASSGQVSLLSVLEQTGLPTDALSGGAASPSLDPSLRGLGGLGGLDLPVPLCTVSSAHILPPQVLGQRGVALKALSDSLAKDVASGRLGLCSGLPDGRSNNDIPGATTLGDPRFSRLGGLDLNPAFPSCASACGSDSLVKPPHPSGLGGLVLPSPSGTNLPGADAIGFRASTGQPEISRPLLPGASSVAEPDWNAIHVEVGEPVLHSIRKAYPALALPSLGCYDSKGCLVPLSATFPAATALRIWVASGTCLPAGLNPPCVRLGALGEQVAPVLAARSRLSVLASQGLCLADDQVFQALKLIASSCHEVCAIDPLLFTEAVAAQNPELVRDFCPALSRGTQFITAVPVDGHWVTYSWRMQPGTLRHQAFVRSPSPLPIASGERLLDCQVRLSHFLEGPLARLSQESAAILPLRICGCTRGCFPRSAVMMHLQSLLRLLPPSSSAFKRIAWCVLLFCWVPGPEISLRRALLPF